jgi:hypothetical protein
VVEDAALRRRNVEVCERLLREEAELTRFAARPEPVQGFDGHAVRQRDDRVHVPVGVADDPRRVGEVAEELATCDGKTCLFCDLATDAVDDALVIFDASGAGASGDAES